jgi:hypothetical protein
MASPQVVPPESPFMISLLMPFSVYTIRPKEKKNQNIPPNKHLQQEVTLLFTYIKISTKKKYISQEEICIPTTKQHLQLQATLQKNNNNQFQNITIHASD